MDVWEEEVDLEAADGRGSFKVRIRELPMADGVYASTGCQLWSSAIILARDIIARPDLVIGKSVVEVGAGCGLLGITLARFARHTLITDGDEEAVQNLSHNIDVNRHVWEHSEDECLREVASRVLRWEDLLVAPWPEDERPDIIVASDIIYGNWGDIVARAMLNMLAPKGRILLAASEDRRGGVRAFQNHLENNGFSIIETKLRKPPLGDFRIYECREGPPDDESLAFRCGTPPDAQHELQGYPQIHDDASLSRHAAKVPKSEAVLPGRIWRVVGGRRHGGIIVRHASEGIEKSDYAGRLQHGSLVEEVEVKGQRLLYIKLQGEGPERGWVSFVSAKGAELIRKQQSTAQEKNKPC
eukprot:TRINITY_DN70270_c0_g1_i1.p1 TRINITY_DN70270_c0_g1~~TRINITY_DN70270_c0_g1_i1.p1  ORF type:complete len:356 (+),score=60.58 TRINITY_DN70270_c0_g1_i1:79-1146(+)